MTNRKLVRAGDVDICVETFGSPSDPPILLMGGATGSMDWWRTEFCEQLAGHERFVVRYDPRDTGESTSSPPGAPDYTAEDLLADAVGLLDLLEVERVHLVGLSMGGGLAQWFALEHPDRLASLTLIATSSGPGDDDLPPTTEAISARFENPPPPPEWSNRDEVIEYLVDDNRAYAGTLPFDEEELRSTLTTVLDRTADIEACMTNHWLISGGDDPLRPRLGQITAPTLVMHGTADPMFPLPHGEVLAREIQSARFVPLEGMGHEYPPRPLWDQVIDELVRHTSGRDRSPVAHR